MHEINDKYSNYFFSLYFINADGFISRWWWTSATTWRKTCTWKQMPSTCRGNIPLKSMEKKKSLSFMNTLCMQVIPSVHQGSLTFFLINLYLLSEISFSFFATVLITNLCENDIVVENAPKDHLENERSKTLHWILKKWNKSSGCSSLDRWACCVSIRLKWKHWFSSFWDFSFPLGVFVKETIATKVLSVCSLGWSLKRP